MGEAAFMEKTEFSCLCFAIAEGPFSGVEEKRSWYMIIYYEPSKKAKVERAFKSVGCDISEYEQVAVDPDSRVEEEVTFMFLHGSGSCSCVVNTREYILAEGTDAEDPYGPKDPDGKLWE